MNRSLLVALGLAAGAGCSAPPVGDLGYLLLDRDAREAGIKVDTGGWQGAPLLPLALRPDEAVALVSSGGKVPLPLRAGSLAWIRGGAVEWHAAGDEARIDRVIVDGDARAVKTLAELLGAEVAGRDDGRFLVSGPDLYGRASFMPTPDGITDVEPELAAVQPRLAAEPAQPAQAPLQLGGLRESTGTELVGLYLSDERLLILDTDGGFTLSDACGGNRIRGRYLREDNHVVLAPADADNAAYSLELGQGGELRDATGERFAAAGDEVKR